MPKILVPHRLGAHRIAVKALYRALLTQSKATPFTSTQQNELQNIIRNRFKQARLNQSARGLKVQLEAGYEAIDHLDNAVAGDEESKHYIATLLARAPEKVKLPPPRKQSAQKPKNNGQPDKVKKTSIFDRPLPLEQLSGKRHIPVLFTANRIPVLRIKKPQPASLSHYIDQRIKQRQKWHDTRDHLVEKRVLASYEDSWDELTGKNRRREPEWQRAAYDAVGVVERKIGAEKEKNRIMAERMQGVVDREREMWEREEEERKRGGSDRR